jgi:hypothetical protein
MEKKIVHTPLSTELEGSTEIIQLYRLLAFIVEVD